MRGQLFVGATVMSVAAALLGLPAASAATERLRAAPAAAPTNTWPMFHHDASLSGTTTDTLLSASQAPGLGVRWMSPTRAAAFSSPVVAWNSTLGQTLVYDVNEAGYVTAFDAATGAPVWSQTFSVPIRATPLVDGNDLWMATDANSHLYKLNAATGAIECSLVLPLPVESSPVDGTPPGGVDTVYVATNDSGHENGPVFAVTASSCKVQWRFTGYLHTAGVWTALSFGVGVNGRALLAFGTSDPDTSLYAVDALTGKELWRVKAPIIPPNDGDCGAGVTLSAPGVNGFADGVAYSECKDGIMFAIDMTTGFVLWEANFAAADGTPPGARATPALVGNTLVGGDLGDAFALDATTGKELWSFSTGGYEVLGSPAIVGPVGDQLVAIDDVSGAFRLLRLSDGTQVYHYQLGGYSVSSVADVDGNLITTASDGYLYDFALGGSNVAPPTTTVSSPASGSTVTNPLGSLTVSGTATASHGVSAVYVGIESGGSFGPWWDGTRQAWTPGISQESATLASPGAASTAWSLTLPVPRAGINLQVFASAVDGGVADISAEQPAPAASRSTFSVAADPSLPVLSVSSTWLTPGLVYTVGGSGWHPSEVVTFTLGTTVLKKVTASPSGTIPATSVTVPGAAGFGPSSVQATGTSSPTTTFSVYVSNKWAQWRQSPAKGGLELNDDALGHNVSYNHVNYLNEAWIYPSGSSVASSPAVLQGTAFFGNSSGLVTALSVHTATPVWTYQADGFVDSSPAVDGGLVLFGSGGGTFTALDATTGARVWTTTLGAAVQSSPAVSAGVVYIGTDGGSVFALNELTGTVIWNHTLAGVVRSSPAVDAAAHKLFIGDGSGAVSALTLSSGAPVWSYQTGGAVTATPTVSGTAVVVGSADGNVYSFVQGTGALTWSYATGGAVTASSILQQYVILGSQSGLFAELDPTTGAAVVARNLGSPVVGLSEAVGPKTAFIVVETAGGKVYGIKPLQVGDISWEWDGSGALASAPTIVNSVVYIAGQDGTLRAFTIPGRPVY